MSDGSRRAFIGLTLSAAGAQLLPPAASAVGATRDLPKSEQTVASRSAQAKAPEPRTVCAADSTRGRPLSEQTPVLRSAQAEKTKPRPNVPTLDTVYLVVYRPGDKWLAGQPLEAQPLREHGRYMLALY